MMKDNSSLNYISKAIKRQIFSIFAGPRPEYQRFFDIIEVMVAL
jgi:hypothetical protein